MIERDFNPDYMPTTEQIREHYVYYTGSDMGAAVEAEFDRWLSERDRKLAAATLREAANTIPAVYLNGDSPSAWLDRRADQTWGGRA